MSEMRSAVVAAVLVALVLLVASCGGSPVAPSGPSDPSARYLSTRPQPTSAPTPPVTGASGSVIPTTTTGPVARPNPWLTPGVVAVRDANTVCQQPKRTRQQVPFKEQLQVFAEYGIPFANNLDYGLDYLVPEQLGGSTTATANLWPVPVNGVGFHEKEQLNYKLRLLVCQGQLPLAQAQQQIAGDWYSLWVRYAS